MPAIVGPFCNYYIGYYVPGRRNAISINGRDKTVYGRRHAVRYYHYQPGSRIVQLVIIVYAAN